MKLFINVHIIIIIIIIAGDLWRLLLVKYKSETVRYITRVHKSDESFQIGEHQNTIISSKVVLGVQACWNLTWYLVSFVTIGIEQGRKCDRDWLKS